jgi:polysaccharide biosynthesis transport protein
MTPTPEFSSADTSLRGYLSTLRRRKWILLQALVLVPLSALLFSLRQETLYEAEAEVLISRQNLAAALTGTSDPLAFQQAERLLQTQASLARVPEVARRVLAEVEAPGYDARAFLDASEVATQPNADLLTFSVVDPDAGLAQRLANEYARQFAQYRSELDTANLGRARAEVTAQMRELEEAGERQSGLYTALADQEQQLRMLEVLQTSNASVVRAADESTQVQPRPLRNLALGLVLGLLLGVGIAFLWETLDTRLRRPEDIAETLGLTLLGRLPPPPRKIQKDNHLIMLEDPTAPGAEAFRVLRTNLEFSSLDQEVRTLMVTSALPGEGKSTTAANLAATVARAGKRVALVDLDLRRPFLHEFFDLGGRPGLTNVALGQVALRDALVPIAVAEEGNEKRDGPRANGHDRGAGYLFVLPSGPSPPNPGEFVGADAVRRILSSLSEEADLVVVDSPPVLRVGDALTLSSKVDAVLIVVRQGLIRRDTAQELRRALEGLPAPVLGFAVTGNRPDSTYGYRYYGSRQTPRSAPQREGRVSA